MIENQISGYFYNECFSEINEEECTAFQSMAWCLIIHENTIKNCSNALQAFSFWTLFLCTLYFPFHKGKDTYGISQLNQAFSILYIFSPFSFVFRNALITST